MKCLLPHVTFSVTHGSHGFITINKHMLYLDCENGHTVFFGLGNSTLMFTDRKDTRFMGIMGVM